VLNCLPIFFGSPPPHESGPETRSEGFTSDAITKASIDSLKKRVRKRWSLNGYRCSHCPKIFNSSSAKFHHERNHTKPFKCTVCSQGWPSNFARLLHMARKHSQKKPKEDLPISTHPKKLKLNSAQGISPVVQIYTCSECPFTTKNHPALYAHKKHHGTQHAHKVCPNRHFMFHSAWLANKFEWTGNVILVHISLFLIYNIFILKLVSTLFLCIHENCQSLSTYQPQSFAVLKDKGSLDERAGRLYDMPHLQPDCSHGAHDCSQEGLPPGVETLLVHKVPLCNWKRYHNVFPPQITRNPKWIRKLNFIQFFGT